MGKTTKLGLGITVDPEERNAFDACAILREATGLAFAQPMLIGRKLPPEIIAQRWLDKNTDPAIRTALLKALANGHE